MGCPRDEQLLGPVAARSRQSEWLAGGATVGGRQGSCRGPGQGLCGEEEEEEGSTVRAEGTGRRHRTEDQVGAWGSLASDCSSSSAFH